MSSPSLRWRRPSRKPSTPFFPGAWPDTSAQDISLTQELPIHMPSPTNKKYLDIPLLNLDHVTDFHRRVSESLNSRQSSPRPIIPTSSISTSSHLSMITDATNNTASSALATPETLSPIDSPTSTRFRPSPWQNSPARIRTSANDDNNIADQSYTEEGFCLIPSSSSSPVSLTLQLPLTIPPHTLSFSPESVASYFSTSEQATRIDSQDLPSPSSASTALSSPGQSAYPSASVSPEFAQSFYPVAENNNILQTTPSVESENGDGSDSPVLPSDEGGSTVLSPVPGTTRKHGAGQLSIADMDAFGLHTRDASACDSLRSIPTSFVSGEAAGSTAQHHSSIAPDALPNHADRRLSSPLSFTFNLSSISLSLQGAHEGVLTSDEVSPSGARRSLTAPQLPVAQHQRTISTVTGGHPTGSAQHTLGSKTTRFVKLKTFGKRIKEVLRLKSRPYQTESKIGVTTTTAVTDVEYTFEHPVAPRPPLFKQSDAHEERAKTAEKLCRNERRKTMPVPAKLQVSRPLPLRPASFLPLDPTPLTSSEAKVLHNGSGNWIAKHPQSVPPKSTTHSPVPRRTASNLAMAPRSPRPSPARVRTSTSPARTSGAERTSARRFSLSSAVNKSHLDIIRNTVVPHPPLPAVYIERSRRCSDVSGRDRYGGSNVALSSTTNEPRLLSPHVVSNSKKTSFSGSKRREVQVAGHLSSAATSQDGDISDADMIYVPRPADGSPSSRTSRRKSSASIFRGGSKDTGLGISSSPNGPAKKRSRGFSFSKRSLKGRSLPVMNTHVPPPVPTLPGTSTSAGREGTVFNSLFKGISPHKDVRDMRKMQLLRSPSSIGCRDFDPNLVPETMSFAQTPDFRSSAAFSTDDSDWVTPEMPAAPVHAIHMDNLGGDMTVTSAGLAREEDDADEVERDREDREEERGFLRALGLEFEAIARRAEEQV